MELNEFRQNILENIRSNAEISRDFFRSTFIEEMATRLIEAEEISEFQLCQFEGTGTRSRKLQIDGYTFDDVDNSVTLIIGDFTNDDKLNNLSIPEVKVYFTLLKNFLEEVLNGKMTDGSIEESHPAFGVAMELILLRDTISKFKFILVSDKFLKTTSRVWESEEVKGFECELHIWDISRFHHVYLSSSGRDDLTINFQQDFESIGLPCLKAGGSEGEYEAYLCMIPGELLANIYNKYGSRLLEGNVRSFLSIKGKVNKGIQTTLIEQPEMFFAYNNGITATAEGVEIKNTSSSSLIKSLSNLQIVNGGQTTASLGTAKRKGIDISKVFVQMKLSVLPPQKAEALIPKISRYANMQNKVSDADFFSNHPYHIKLEEASRRIFTPPIHGMQHGTHWFYERARGQFLNEQAKMTPAQKAKFLSLSPKKQLLVKTDVAKILNTFRCIPHVVSLGGQKNFINFAQYITEIWDKNNNTFDDEYFKEVIAKVVLFKSTEDIVSDQEWYQNSYRANIVTYTLSKLQELVTAQGQGKQINYKYIWDHQGISDILASQVEDISAVIFKVLLDPKRQKENVTEWAKLQQCLLKVQNLHVTLSKNFLKELIDPPILKKKQSSLTILTEPTYGSYKHLNQFEAFKNLLKFGLLHNLLDRGETDFLRSVISNPITNLTPLESKSFLMIKKKLVKIGYEE
jgi:hypothetical protein